MMRDGSDRLANANETSAGGLIEEVHAVRDSVEELYILLDHVWRNRQELHDILAAIKEENAARDEEIIACCHCDASPPSLAAAVREGWKDLQYDDGVNWNYLGISPRMPGPGGPSRGAGSESERPSETPLCLISGGANRPQLAGIVSRFRGRFTTMRNQTMCGTLGPGIGTVPVSLLCHSTGGSHGLCNKKAADGSMARGFSRNAARHPPPTQGSISPP